MTDGHHRPATPAEVERRLRQEAGFGCARCGHPYLEYHHIVPFSQEKHFRIEDMVALCGNCHASVAKLPLDRQYAIKKSPFNIQNGFLKGALEFDKRDLVFKVGGNWYENTAIILQYRDQPIISCGINDGQANVSLNLFGEQGNPMLSVKNNDVSFRVGDFWDFEYSHNVVVARHGPGRIAVRMDFRNPDATIEGNVWIGGRLVKLGPSETILPGQNTLRNCRFKNSGIGIHLR